MPFGALFGSLVFGIVATAIGWRLLQSASATVGLNGGLLLVLGPSLALGLLLRRPWARWTGLLGAPALAFLSGLLITHGPGETLGIVGMMGSLLAFVLLAVPKTGCISEPSGARKSIIAGRVLAASAFAAMAGLAVASLVPAVRDSPRESPGSKREAPSPSAPIVRPQTLEWHDFAPGLERAKATGQPVLVDFFADWCGPCKLMDRETFRDAEVIARLGEVVPVRVDAEEESPRAGVSGSDLAARYDVSAYPTIALIDADGRVVSRFSGYRGPRDFLRWFESAVGRAQRPA